MPLCYSVYEKPVAALIHRMRVVAENFLASVVSHSGLHLLRPFCPSPILLRTETQFTQLERVQ